MERFGMLEILAPDCPECGTQSLVYNGNYYCTNCDWALPHPTPSKFRVLYKDMYVSLMRLRGKNPDKEIIQSILLGMD